MTNKINVEYVLGTLFFVLACVDCGLSITLRSWWGVLGCFGFTLAAVIWFRTGARRKIRR